MLYKSTNFLSYSSTTPPASSVPTQDHLQSSKATSCRTGQRVRPLGEFCTEDKYCTDPESFFVFCFRNKWASLHVPAPEQLSRPLPALQKYPQAAAPEIFQHPWRAFQNRIHFWSSSTTKTASSHPRQGLQETKRPESYHSFLPCVNATREGEKRLLHLHGLIPPPRGL